MNALHPYFVFEGLTMPMIVTVHRPGPDRTNWGVSRHHDQLLVISKGEKVPDCSPLPVMVLRQTSQGRVCLLPVVNGPEGYVGPLAGGNYAVGGSDFRQALAGLLGPDFLGAVPIHDRYESQELHDQLAC